MSFLPIALGILGLGAAYYVYGQIKTYSVKEGKVADIAGKIHEGAMVFMRREYTLLSMFAGAVTVILAIFLDLSTAFAFVVGALTSASAGYIGMYTATQANSRTTTAATEKGIAEALSVAFFGGSIMGLCHTESV